MRLVVWLVVLIALFAVILLVVRNTNLLASLRPNTLTQTTPVLEEPPAEETPLTMYLSPQNDSGQSGSFILNEVNGKTLVNIDLTGFTTGVSQPAHIHVGTCPGVGAVKYPLTNVVNGKSQTTLNVSLAQLRNETPLGLNVHKSDTEPQTSVACGDLIL